MIHTFNPERLKQLYSPPQDSHKGQNGKVLVVGGSKLFHAASLWALSIASKIVDMVFYASVPENNEIVLRAKEEFRNGIVVPRSDIAHYAKEADCILIGPGLVRTESRIRQLRPKDDNPLDLTDESRIKNFNDIQMVEDEGEQTYWLTKLLLEKFPRKKFVLDAGSLQMMEPEWLLSLKRMPILTPHKGEFTILFQKEEHDVYKMAKKYQCVILLKGQEDTVCSSDTCVTMPGGNAGMTKGGTGDVLAGLTAALYAQNSDPFLVAQAASFLNKKAGERLFERVGYYFNASDLVEELPRVMKEYVQADVYHN